MSSKEPKPAKNDSLAEEAALRRKVKDAIVCQSLQPSQKVTEYIIADMFGTTRTMAKGLMAQLTAQNFLVAISPRITRVAPLTVSNIKENFLLRKMLIPDLVAMSVPHIDVTEIETINRSIAEATVDPDNEEEVLKVLRLNHDYNLRPVSGISYELPISWVKLLEDMAMRIYWLYVREQGQLPFFSHTQGQIVKAIVDGDAVSIKRLVRESLDESEDRILNSIFSNEKFYSQDLVI